MMCMTRSKKGQKYVRLCAWYMDNFGIPKEAIAVDTQATYRTSRYVYFAGEDTPTARYPCEVWPHYSPAKYAQLASAAEGGE